MTPHDFGVKACGSHQCIAAQRDGVLCADGECDRENGVRPDGVPVAGHHTFPQETPPIPEEPQSPTTTGGEKE